MEPHTALTLWQWIVDKWRKFLAMLAIGSNLLKIMDEQKEIQKRLGNIENIMTSPEHQLAELQLLITRLDVRKKEHEEEISRLKKGSAEEIAKHASRVNDLEQENKKVADLSEEAQGYVKKALAIIIARDKEIDNLKDELAQLKSKAPASILAQNWIPPWRAQSPYSKPLAESLLSGELGEQAGTVSLEDRLAKLPTRKENR